MSRKDSCKLRQKPLVNRTFCIYVVRKILFLSGKSQGILKSDACGNHVHSKRMSSSCGQFLLIKQTHTNNHYLRLSINNTDHNDVNIYAQRVIPGLFSWCVICWFYFLWNMNLGDHSSWLVTWRFCVTC